MATYMVIGGTGFVGSYIARNLVRAGEKVVTYDYLPSNVINKVLSPEELKEVVMTTGNVTDLVKLLHVINEHKVDYIIHLVSLLHPISNEEPMNAIDVNIKGHGTVLEAVRLSNVKKLVWTSSVVVFGSRASHPSVPLPNDAHHHPVSIYGATKSFNEFLTNHYIDTWGVDALGLRFTIIYGPGRVRGASSFVNELCVNPALGKPAVVPFGDDVVDWQYVEDAASLLIKCCTVGPTKTKVFNTQFDTRSIKEAGAYVQKLIPDAQISYEPGEFGIAWELDDSLLQQEIGFKPEFSMERGIKEMINFVRKEHNLPLLDD